MKYSNLRDRWMIVNLQRIASIRLVRAMANAWLENVTAKPDGREPTARRLMSKFSSAYHGVPITVLMIWKRVFACAMIFGPDQTVRKVG